MKKAKKKKTTKKVRLPPTHAKLLRGVIMDWSPRYEGSVSAPVWNEVHKIKNQIAHVALYQMGCALQSLERRFLSVLRNTIENQHKRSKIWNINIDR